MIAGRLGSEVHLGSRPSPRTRSGSRSSRRGQAGWRLVTVATTDAAMAVELARELVGDSPEHGHAATLDEQADEAQPPAARCATRAGRSHRERGGAAPPGCRRRATLPACRGSRPPCGDPSATGPARHPRGRPWKAASAYRRAATTGRAISCWSPIGLARNASTEPALPVRGHVLAGRRRDAGRPGRGPRPRRGAPRSHAAFSASISAVARSFKRVISSRVAARSCSAALGGDPLARLRISLASRRASWRGGEALLLGRLASRRACSASLSPCSIRPAGRRGSG